MPEHHRLLSAQTQVPTHHQMRTTLRRPLGWVLRRTSLAAVTSSQDGDFLQSRYSFCPVLRIFMLTRTELPCGAEIETNSSTTHHYRLLAASGGAAFQTHACNLFSYIFIHQEASASPGRSQQQPALTPLYVVCHIPAPGAHSSKRS